MTRGSQRLMKMGANKSSVVMDCVQTKVGLLLVLPKPAKESDPGAWRHNELSLPSMTASTPRRLSIQKAPSGPVQEVKPCKLSMPVAPDWMCTRRL
jgi:hypothetical protein